jgi:hypothetical protein
MKCNVGGFDRIARIILGAGLLFAGYYYQSYWGLVGIIPLATGAMGWCPLYLPIQFSTCEKKT